LQRLFPDQRPVALEEAYASLGLEEWAREERPYVIANMVATVDGRATLAGRTKSISSDADRFLFHSLRGQVDAVMAGTGTIAIERYGPIVRDPERRKRRVERGLAPVPLAVTATRSLELPAQAPLFQDAESRIVVLTSSEREAPPSPAQVTVERVKAGSTSDSVPELDLVRGMEVLRRTYGVRTLLLEGGPTLLGAMLEAVEGAALPQPLELDLLGLLEDERYLFFRYAIGSR
jgi:riboflavin biosynthesis pyrimidine reductase